MPTLGFLKKKRTKDSQGSIDPPTSPARDSPTSPTVSKQLSSGDGYTNSSSTVQTPVDSANSQAASQKASDPMQTSNYHQQYSAPPQRPPQQQIPQQQNAASIQNIMNPAQSGDGGFPNGQIYQQTVTNPVRETKGKYTLTDFVIQRTLGTGSFGRVHLVQSKHNQRFYAVKVLKKAQVVKMKQVEHTNDERRMLQKVKHPFLITLWGTFQDSKNLYMVMDFIEGGELFSLLRKSQVGPLIMFFHCQIVLMAIIEISEPRRQILRC